MDDVHLGLGHSGCAVGAVVVVDFGVEVVGLRYVGLPGVLGVDGDIEAGGEDGDFHLVAEVGSFVETPHHVDLVVDGADKVGKLGGFGHVERLVGIVGDVEYHEHLLRADDVGVLEKGRVEGVLDGFCHTVFAFAVARGDDGCAALAQGGVDVVEVAVDYASLGDDFGDALCGVQQGVVGLGEGVDDFVVGIYLGEAFVVDHEQGVDVLGHFLGAFDGLEHFLAAFEEEGYGDDAHGEDVAFLGHAGHNRAGAGAGAAAHAGGDEHHVGGVVEEVLYGLGVFLGEFLGYFGLASGSASGADYEFGGHVRRVEHLTVGVD